MFAYSIIQQRQRRGQSDGGWPGDELAEQRDHAAGAELALRESDEGRQRTASWTRRAQLLRVGRSEPQQVVRESGGPGEDEWSGEWGV